jgi:hypothetical protein
MISLSIQAAAARCRFLAQATGTFAHWVEVMTGTGTSSMVGSPVAAIGSSSHRLAEPARPADLVAQLVDQRHQAVAGDQAAN